ncbi:hypothetical protein LY78DRAFT_656568 [Colletotrichum sublineola]|uniref:Polarity defective-2 n=1 Tax=Colletotrichum sublineola TaxID=1173701 RepID=A0A066XTA2_COLSU|nr:hypothetical protein LY78DRAFT_656568 [Colletotrichum sublineola]KDN69165.1 hypothetical protein CSUB01_06668 [Colletotrichum sublineola]
MAPANFKTYEAQARLLRAIVAAHPEVKWNYKDIQKFYGSDMTKDALNHRFRAIRNHIWTLQQANDQGIDCKNIPVDLPKEKKEIAKFFGESTTDGIQFQFRSIKKDAESLKRTVNSGGNPATALSLPASTTSSAFSTPRKPRTPSTKTHVSGGGRSTTAKKTKQVKPAPVSVSEEDEEEDDVDYNELEDTPSKSRIRDHILDGRVSKNRHTPNPRRSATPSRAATIAAAANIAQAAAVDLTTSDSEVNTPDNVVNYELHVPVNAKPPAIQQHAQAQSIFGDPASAYEQSIVQPAAHPTIQPAAQPAIQPASNGGYSGHSSFDPSQGVGLFNEDPLNFSFVDNMGPGGGDFDPYTGNDGEI